jgi:hypothetical protein
MHGAFRPGSECRETLRHAAAGPFVFVTNRAAIPMALTRYLALPFRFRPWRPLHLRLIVQDMGAAAGPCPVRDDRSHLAAAIDWLCRAQDVREGETDAGGVSAGWSFEDGWLPSYPETSGYIVETLLAASRVLDDPGLQRRAGRILDWELSIQNPDGSFPGHFGEPGSRPVIFNTGQIVHGLMAGSGELGRPECLEAALRAGAWMLDQQDQDGCWRRSVHNGVPHTYNTRAAWALLRVAEVAGEARLRRGALANLDWALRQQTESGWLAANAFTASGVPFTHNIAYAVRGLLEGGLLSGEERFVAAAERAALGVMAAQRDDGWLAGTFADGWRATAGYCCLTGLAQMALVWMRLARSRNHPAMEEAATRGIDAVKRRHRVEDRDPRVRGAVAGSGPIWGRYSMFEFPNWAAKFFADALMMHAHRDMAIPAPDPVSVAGAQEAVAHG